MYSRCNHWFPAPLAPSVFPEFGICNGFGTFRIGAGANLCVYILGCLGATLSPDSLSPHSIPSAMPSEVDPSTLDLAPHDLNKISKKDLAKHLSSLQVMYAERGKKYGTQLW
jgi:hypothetical protein